MLHNYGFILEAHKLGIKKDFFYQVEFDTKELIRDIQNWGCDIFDFIEISEELALNILIWILKEYDSIDLCLPLGVGDHRDGKHDIFKKCWERVNDRKYEASYINPEIVYNIIGKDAWYKFLMSFWDGYPTCVKNWHPEYLAFKPEFDVPPTNSIITPFLNYYEDLIKIFIKKGISPYLILEILDLTNYRQFFKESEIMSVITRIKGEDQIYTNDGIFLDVLEYSNDDFSQKLDESSQARRKNTKILHACELFLMFLNCDHELKSKIDTKFIKTFKAKAKELVEDKTVQQYKLDFKILADFFEDEITNKDAFERHKTNIHKFIKYYNRFLTYYRIIHNQTLL